MTDQDFEEHIEQKAKELLSEYLKDNNYSEKWTVTEVFIEGSKAAKELLVDYPLNNMDRELKLIEISTDQVEKIIRLTEQNERYRKALEKIQDPNDTNCMMTLASEALKEPNENNG